jgi:hypothetical protein
MNLIAAPAKMSARSRRRGQALFEFSMVAPLFFVIVLVAIQLFCWSYDRQVASRAVRVGATRGNEALAAVNFRFALDPHLATVYLPGVNDGVFADLPGGAAACREAASRVTAGVVPATRLGWDWGCLYDVSSGVAAANGGAFTAGDTAASLRAPLDTALANAYSELGRFYIGPLRDGSISACYAVWNAAVSPPGPSCVLERTATFGNSLSGPLSISWGVGVAKAPILSPTTTNAPSFLIVSMHVDSLNLQGHDLFAIDAKTVQVINRFITSCSAPADYGGYTAGSCGSAY